MPRLYWKITKILTVLSFLPLINLSFLQIIAEAQAAQEQQELQENRPKIGLVLSGGGARGAAHVGVLKVLEENYVPIDYIVGTSMGAIVGGLYASGMSVQEIEQMFKEIDWEDIFSDRPSEKYLSFRHKRDQERLMDFELGVKDGKIALPKGAIPGQKLGFKLKELTLHTLGTENFDDLAIPFRAISADLATGEVVIHEQGTLSKAIRASMSMPGVFAPVRIGDRLLVDGGIVNNLPIDVAQEMGADLIIAVDVGIPLQQADKLRSVIDITTQVINIFTKQNVNRSLALLKENDLLIMPELGDIYTGSFQQAYEAVQLGEKSAREVIGKIKRYAISAVDYQQLSNRQQARKSPALKIDFVKVKPTTRVSPEAIKGKIKTEPGLTFDLEKVQADLTRIYAIGDFATVDFKIIEEQGQTGLLIDAQEKEWGPNYLRFGLNLKADSDGDSEYTVLADYRMTQLNELGAEWKNVFQFGETRGIFSEFYQPLDMQGHFFIASQITLGQFLEDVYQDQDRIAEYRADYLGAGVDLGINFGSFAEGRLGIRRAVVDAEPEVGGTNLPEFSNIQEAALVARLEYDQFDDHRFPKYGLSSGIQLFISEQGLGADLSYQKLEFALTKATTFGQKHTLLTSLDAGISIDEDTPFYDEFTLGGFLSLSGYAEQQLRGQHKALASLIYLYKVAHIPGFVGNVYIGGSLEAGNVWDDRDDIAIEDLLIGGACLIGFDTVVGPLYLGYGVAEGSSEGRGPIYF